MSVLFAIGLGLLVGAPAQMPYETVQPWAYRSPSGAVELFVDPTQRSGAGPAWCRLTRDGTLEWERELAFTFLDALVEEDGSAAGFAYPEGLGRYEGTLVVATLAPDGSERGGERLARVSTRVLHGAPIPTVLRMLRCEDGFALEIAGRQRGDESWWIHDWKSGVRFREQKMAPVERGTVAPPQSMESPSIPPLELTLLGRVVFPWPVPPIEPGAEKPLEEHRQRGAHRVFVDGSGRVWISELSTRRVHAFDSTGTPLFVRVPDPQHFRLGRPVEWLCALEDGALFVGADGAIESFDPSGARGPRVDIGNEQTPRWWSLPGSKMRWEVASARSIRLRDSDGVERISTERAPNGRWLEALLLSAMDVDGTLAVLDEPIGSKPRDPSVWLHLFAPTGQPLRSVRVDGARWSPGGLAIHDGRVALLGDGAVLFLAARDGTLVGRATLPDDLRDPAYLYFSPSGELWVFPHYRAEMWRFAVPP